MYPEEFRLVRYKLAGIPNINWGGCAVAALAMYRVGVRLGMNVQLMYLYDYDWDELYERNDNALVFNGTFGGCSHAVCVVDNTALDSLCETFIWLFPYRHFLPEKAVVASINDGKWNPRFKRDVYIPWIEEAIGEKLNINI